jgi:membrane-bound metal-dependent hydrolase YbcI (DUF457 family)
VYWVPFAVLSVGEQYWIRNLVSALAALAIGWFIWNTTKAGSAQGLASSIFSGAVMLGGIGFFGGFFGPIIFTPSANQGPMLGIFITGPLGFLIGAFGGLIYWLVRSKSADKA